jgi:serine/threonine-protein kinase
VVLQAAVVVSRINLAQAFMKTSQAKRQSCAGQVVADNQNGKAPSAWAFGDLVGSEPKITQLDTQEGQSGWQCQRVLSRSANLVVDVSACGFHITDQADRIAGKMVGNATS